MHGKEFGSKLCWKLDRFGLSWKVQANNSPTSIGMLQLYTFEFHEFFNIKLSNISIFQRCKTKFREQMADQPTGILKPNWGSWEVKIQEGFSKWYFDIDHVAHESYAHIRNINLKIIRSRKMNCYQSSTRELKKLQSDYLELKQTSHTSLYAHGIWKTSISTKLPLMELIS